MKNRSTTHVLVEISTKAIPSTKVLLMPVNDPHTVSNIDALRSLLADTVVSVADFNPRDPSLEAWQKAVADGKTKLGYEGWRALNA